MRSFFLQMINTPDGIVTRHLLRLDALDSVYVTFEWSELSPNQCAQLHVHVNVYMYVCVLCVCVLQAWESSHLHTHLVWIVDPLADPPVPVSAVNIV